MRKGALSRRCRENGALGALDLLLRGLPALGAAGRGPGAPIIDKAKRASYLTGNPVQRRENGRFRPFSRFLLLSALSGRPSVALDGPNGGANAFGPDGI